MARFFWNSSWIIVSLFFGCVTFTLTSEGFVPLAEEEKRISNSFSSPWEQTLSQSALAWVGSPRLSLEGRNFPMDCTGVVMAAYFRAGKDLAPYMASYPGGGVQRLYQWLKNQDLLVRNPRPGDLIFWDNTFDANNDRRWNDELTHVGVVVSLEEGGQITFVHHNYRRGVVRGQMNLSKADTHIEEGVVINDPMRMAYPDRPREPLWLSSHLFRAFGRPPEPK